MRITIYSCFAGILWSTMLVCVVRFFRHKYMPNHKNDIYYFLLLYLACIVRLVFPIDFSFTYGFALKGIYSDFFNFLLWERFHVFLFDLSVLNIICICVCIISFQKVVAMLICYKREQTIFGMCSDYASEQITAVNARISSILDRIPGVVVLTDNLVRTPMVTGIRKAKVILPAAEYSDEELYYILIHEYMHIIHHDLLLILFLNLVRCIFWWIPGISFLGNDLRRIVELKCDSEAIAEMSPTQKAKYMSTLLNTLKRAQMLGKKAKDNISPVSLIWNENESVMAERFKMILKENKDNRYRMIFRLCIPFTVLFLLSYLFIPLPSYEPDIDEIEIGGAIALSDDNACIEYKNGQYTLYTSEGEQYGIDETFASLMMDSGIPVQKEGNTANEN